MVVNDNHRRHTMVILIKTEGTINKGRTSDLVPYNINKLVKNTMIGLTSKKVIKSSGLAVGTTHIRIMISGMTIPSTSAMRKRKNRYNLLEEDKPSNIKSTQITTEMATLVTSESRNLEESMACFTGTESVDCSSKRQLSKSGKQTKIIVIKCIEQTVKRVFMKPSNLNLLQK